jgi:thiamine biosynthesis lipoprotein
MSTRRDFLKIKTARPAPGGYWLHVHRTAMACRFEVTLPIWEQAGVEVAQQALDEIDKLEDQLTIFRDSSEISYINRNAADQSIRIEQNLFSFLQACQQLYEETDGAFDITSAPLSRCWGFVRREGGIPETDELENALAKVGGAKVSLDSQSQSIRFAHTGVEINLGSIGKGYSLDRTAKTIRRRIRTALLSAGSSSILAIGSGDRGHNGWKVGLRHPRDKEKRLGVLRLRDCAMATSGSDEQFFEHSGVRYGHIIDPRSGWPASQVSGVTVVAQSAAVADALATAFYVGGPELAERYCSSHADVLVVMLTSDSNQPVIFGDSNNCELELTNE